MSKFSMIEKKNTDFAFDLLRLEARWEDQSWDKVRDHIRRMRRKAVMRQQDVASRQTKTRKFGKESAREKRGNNIFFFHSCSYPSNMLKAISLCVRLGSSRSRH